LHNPQALILTNKKETAISIVLSQKSTPPHVRLPPSLPPHLSLTCLAVQPCGIYVLRKEKGVDLTTRSVQAVSRFSSEPESYLHCALPAGAYVLLFTTFNPDLEGKFNVEVFSNKTIVWKPVK